jgi:hypothetical protein
MTVKEVFAKYSGKEDIAVYVYDECVGYNLDVTDEIYDDDIIANAQVEEYELFGDDTVGYRLYIRLALPEDNELSDI